MKKKALIPGIAVLIGLVTSFLCINNPEPLDVSYGRVIVTVEGSGRVEGLTDSLIPVGTVLTLTAVENDGYLFGGWGIDTAKFRNPLVLTVKSDIRLTALFVKKPSSMIHVVAKGKGFMMGSDSIKEAYSSKQVYFDYDFYAANAEVTAGEYRQLVPEYTQLSGDSFPVGNISWYNAILYCNALSKRDGYDTVYSYSAICRDLGCPFILEDWKIHYDRTGYRLPTEAEWEYICRAGTTGDYWWDSGQIDSCAWYSANSNMKPQPVKTRKPNPWGFYDLNGNVAEWVNDWFDIFTTAIDTNPVGPVDKTQQTFEASFLRPVRGGSYSLGISYMTASTRNGPYDVGAFFKQPDIGFRVVLGAFSTKKHSDPRLPTSIIDSSKVVVTKTDLLSFIGTSSVKLAYVQAEKLKRYLFIADFTGDGISVTQCGRDSNVYCPTISQDGNFVAYSSSGEGFAEACSLTVRSLSSGFNDAPLLRMPGTIPRWWVSPVEKDTFLIYTTGASRNQDEAATWHNEKTMRIKMQGGKVAGPAEVVWPYGSYHGGMSVDGRFIATGYQVTRLVDMQVKDTNIFYFMPPYSGRDDITQTCNVSMSPSASEPGEVMLLDFGYNGVSTITGASYGFHSVIFVCNTNMLNSKHVSKWFQVPAAYSQWDYPEWSNHPDFAASLAIAFSGSDVIYAIDCKNKAYQQLVSGTKLRDVYLWIDPLKLSQKNDPYRYFGRYDLPVQSGGQIMLSKKLHLFWKYRDEWECAMLGSSTAYFGFDPSKMSLKSINLGCFASNIMTADALAEMYCFSQLKKLKAIVVDLMSYSFTTNSYKDAPRLTGLLDSKGFEFDSAEHFYKDGIPTGIDSIIKTWGAQEWSGFDTLGFHTTVQATGWGEPVIDKGDYSIDDSVVQASIAIVKRLAEIAAKDSVHVLIVNTPQHPGYATSENMGRLGPGVQTYRKLEAILQTIELQNNYFHYYDANNFGNHDYAPDEAYDANHLSPKGAAKLTGRIDSLINTYLTR